MEGETPTSVLVGVEVPVPKENFKLRPKVQSSVSRRKLNFKLWPQNLKFSFRPGQSLKFSSWTEN